MNNNLESDKIWKRVRKSKFCKRIQQWFEAQPLYKEHLDFFRENKIEKKSSYLSKFKLFNFFFLILYPLVLAALFFLIGQKKTAFQFGWYLIRGYIYRLNNKYILEYLGLIKPIYGFCFLICFFCRYVLDIFHFTCKKRG